MSAVFNTANALSKATGRAKSDVANKLVSMFLHEISRRACAAGGMAVSDPSYTSQVSAAFPGCCVYCATPLEKDRAAVEHLDGMNRFRAGLHLPGNVAVACRRCNSEKRRDDQKPELMLAPSGWESFLAHNGSSCDFGCPTCGYWAGVWPDSRHRKEWLLERTRTIHEFRKPFGHFQDWSHAIAPMLRSKIEALYRACQRFATEEIARLIEEVDLRLQDLEGSNQGWMRPPLIAGSGNQSVAGVSPTTSP